ncbi:hypothetical protein SK128_018309 [Halocaridina rubra]|uniref:Sarcoglycan alpha/epsilon second domain-containing protein n=1 Tax=Halocaridina rubra TaxID=373956 RepID=A0AAN8WR37_HALRR
MNVDELLVGARWERLREVMANLWNVSTDQIFVTSLTSAIHRGDRMPARPDQKEGVYVSYGSSTNFSKALFELEKEVEPLWDHQPCPPYFKKTSYERFFRHKGFAVDWCSFKMVSLNIKVKNRIFLLNLGSFPLVTETYTVSKEILDCGERSVSMNNDVDEQS